MKLVDFKDIHLGERCFILGTGPSLRVTDLSIIKNEIIFGCNTLYRGLKSWGLNCKYYGVSDIHVLRNHYSGISKLDTTLFLALYSVKEYLDNKDKYNKLNPVIINGRVEEGFSKDLTKGVHWGSSVVYDVCLHMCYYMGFKDVYLLGVDWDYSEVHHFDGSQADYIGQGAVGDWKRALESYPQARIAFEELGRKIYNSTVGGQLEVFDRIALEDIEDIYDGKLPYISDSNVKLTKDQILRVYAWYAKIYHNLENNKKWYVGIPHNWWWGMNYIQFLKKLPEHIVKEEGWDIRTW